MLQTGINHIPDIAFPMSCGFQLFVQLDELTLSKNFIWNWQEKARWIKFEEDLEEGSERWGSLMCPL